jgi:hypothetical protein
LFTKKVSGKRQPDLVWIPEDLAALRPRPSRAVFYGIRYGERDEDWIASFLQLQPIVGGPTTPDAVMTVRVYDLSSFDWDSLMLIKDDRYRQQERQALDAARMTEGAHICRKALHVSVSPHEIAAARVAYYMARAPVVPRGRPKRLSVGQSDTSGNMELYVNGKQVLVGPVPTVAKGGWHSVPVPPHVLVEGDNEVTFRLSASTGARVFPGVASSTGAAGSASAASRDGGCTWTGESLSPAAAGEEEPLEGEYVVRLFLRKQDCRL